MYMQKLTLKLEKMTNYLIKFNNKEGFFGKMQKKISRLILE